MKLIDSQVFEITELDIFKKIELIGRTCYKSESSITSDSASRFVTNLVKNQHLAMLEHADITFMAHRDYIQQDLDNGISPNPFLTVTIEPGADHALVTSNLRVLIEGEGALLDCLRSMLCYGAPDIADVLIPDFTPQLDIDDGCILQPSQMHPKFQDKHIRKTFRFITDRGVSHELVRHRVASFAQESTRYCNYQKDKFGNEITFIKPSTWDEMPSFAQLRFKESLKSSEEAYMALIDNGLKPQQARAVLPNALKTEIIVTASEAEWHHIADLRLRGTTGAPHPDIKELMQKLQSIFPEI